MPRRNKHTGLTERQAESFCTMWLDPWSYSSIAIAERFDTVVGKLQRTAWNLGLGPRPNQEWEKVPRMTKKQLMAKRRREVDDSRRRQRIRQPSPVIAVGDLRGLDAETRALIDAALEKKRRKKS